MTLAPPIESHLCLAGLAVAYPPDVVDGRDLGMTAEDQRDSGFRQVHVARDPADTLELMCEAARAALEDAGVRPGEVQALLVLRNGFYERHATALLSLLAADRLGVPGGLCLDLKNPGCAGLLLGVEHAAALLSRREVERVLVLGGGVIDPPGQRWLADPPIPGRPRSGILSGDGAYAVVVGRGRGALEILSHRILLDREFADLTRVAGGVDVTDRQEFARWLKAAPLWSARALMDAMLASGTAERPHILVGTNSRMKLETFERLAHGAADPRIRRMLDLQVEEMGRVGHVVGGDGCGSLVALLRAGALAPGDLIVCLEIGEAYFYGAGVLRAADPAGRA